jgi:hypothetical protein
MALQIIRAAECGEGALKIVFLTAKMGHEGL